MIENVSYTGQYNLASYIEWLRLLDRWQIDFEDDLQSLRAALEKVITEAMAENPEDRTIHPITWARTYIVTGSNGKRNLRPDCTKADFELFTGALIANNKDYPAIPKEAARLWDYLVNAKVRKPTVGSLNDLQFHNKQFIGRPTFDRTVNTKMPPVVNKDRRHIIAWHSIRGFFNIAYSCDKRLTIDTLSTAISKLADTNKKIFKRSGILTKGLDSELAIPMRALYIANSNVNNLWQGSRSENSGINFGQRLVNADIADWEYDGTAALVRTLEKWEVTTTGGASGMKIPTLARFLAYKATLAHLGAKLGITSPFNAKIISESLRKSTDPHHLIAEAKEFIRMWIIDNLNFDIGFDNKVTEEIFTSRQAILECIPPIAQAIKTSQAERDAIIHVLSTLLALPAEIST